MGRVVTAGMTMSMAREASPGVLPGSPLWLMLEPNSISNFAMTYSKTARSPISKLRARRKGTVTDADAAVEFEADLTMAHLRWWAESFLFARYVGGDVYAPSAATGTAYTVPALSSAQAGRLTYGASAAKTLLFARGFVNPANNGLKVLGAAASPGATSLTVAGNVAETSPTGTIVEVAIAGVRGAAGDLQIDAQGNLISTALNFTTLGLTVGQIIHIGGTDVTHQFFDPDNLGFARVKVVAANKITLEKRDATFALDDGTSTGSGGTPLQIDILYGQFVRNVPIDSADYLEPTNQIELASPKLMSGGLTGYEYALSCYANTWAISIPLSGKAVMTMGLVPTKITKPSTTRASGAAAALSGVQTASFGTASDIARLRIQEVDETGLTTDFKSASLAITNNATGEKVLGTLGAKYVNFGNFEADLTSQIIFTEANVIEAIACDWTVGWDTILLNDDGGFAVDLPTGTLSGGGREYPANASVLMNEVFNAHQENQYGFTMGISIFPVLPIQPC